MANFYIESIEGVTSDDVYTPIKQSTINAVLRGDSIFTKTHARVLQDRTRVLQGRNYYNWVNFEVRRADVEKAVKDQQAVLNAAKENASSKARVIDQQTAALRAQLNSKNTEIANANARLAAENAKNAQLQSALAAKKVEVEKKNKDLTLKKEANASLETTRTQFASTSKISDEMAAFKKEQVKTPQFIATRDKLRQSVLNSRDSATKSAALLQNAGMTKERDEMKKASAEYDKLLTQIDAAIKGKKQ